MFWTSFRFVWGHDFRDSYIPNYQTGLYQFSTLFAEQTFNLQHWGMTAEFIQEFSELKDDVPTITSMKQQPEVCQPDEMFGFEAIAHQHLPEMGLKGALANYNVIYSILQFMLRLLTLYHPV
jgi:hypothetical protein